MAPRLIWGRQAAIHMHPLNAQLNAIYANSLLHKLGGAPDHQAAPKACLVHADAPSDSPRRAASSLSLSSSRSGIPPSSKSRRPAAQGRGKAGSSACQYGAQQVSPWIAERKPCAAAAVAGEVLLLPGAPAVSSELLRGCHGCEAPRR